MSVISHDISAKLRTYLLTCTALTAEIGSRLYVGQFPKKKGVTTSNQANSKVTFKQIGGDSKGQNYRMMFTVRANSLKKAREIGFIISNALTNVSFDISTAGQNLSYWAENEGGINDSFDENTSNSEVFFNIGFTSIF